MPKNLEEQQMQVREMFDGIARRYDRLNTILSYGQDRRWRKRLVRYAKTIPHASILDLAGGTGALTESLLAGLKVERMVCADLSEKMLNGARARFAQKPELGTVELIQCAAEELPFPNASFDLITISFGARNFGDMNAAAVECARILKAGGHLLVMEFLEPRHGVMAALYRFYSWKILPTVGGALTGEPEAYRYLPKSIRKWTDEERLQKALDESGLKSVHRDLMMLGAVELLSARKED